MYICNPVILLPHLPIPPRIKPTKKPPNAQGSTKQKKSDSVSILLFPNKKARRSEPYANLACPFGGKGQGGCGQLIDSVKHCPSLKRTPQIRKNPRLRMGSTSSKTEVFYNFVPIIEKFCQIVETLSSHPSLKNPR